MNPYVIIGAANCIYCQKAKAVLMNKYSDYNYFDLAKEPWIKDLMKLSQLKTVPQVFTPEGKLLGGYEELVAHLDTMDAQG
jgi:glutaredoxin